MDISNPKTPSTVAEHDFLDFMQHGNDFFKIELLRPAKSWYKKALKLNMEVDLVKKRIAECDRLLAFENKVVRIVVSITAVLVLVYLLFFR